MKNRKLITALAMAACLGLALTACSSKDDTKSNVQAEEQSTSSTEKGSTDGSSAADTTKGSTEAGNGETKESGQGESQSTAGESQAASKNVAEDFSKLLKEATKVEQLYDFMDANIENAKADEADTMVLGLFGFVKDLTTLDEDRLDEYSNYTKPEITDFIYMLDLELEQPAKKNGAVAISLEDLISRSGEGEFYLNEYPESPVYEQAYELYYQWISDAITGVEPTAENIAYMADFAEGNDSVNGRIIDEYVQLLKDNGNQVNDAVKAFYAELPQKIQSMYK